MANLKDFLNLIKPIKYWHIKDTYYYQSEIGNHWFFLSSDWLKLSLARILCANLSRRLSVAVHLYPVKNCLIPDNPCQSA